VVKRRVNIGKMNKKSTGIFAFSGGTPVKMRRVIQEKINIRGALRLNTFCPK